MGLDSQTACCTCPFVRCPLSAVREFCVREFCVRVASRQLDLCESFMHKLIKRPLFILALPQFFSFAVYFNAGSAPAWNSAEEILWVSRLPAALVLGCCYFFRLFFFRGLTTVTFSKLPGNYYYFGLFMCQICLMANCKQIADKFLLG